MSDEIIYARPIQELFKSAPKSASHEELIKRAKERWRNRPQSITGYSSFLYTVSGIGEWQYDLVIPDNCYIQIVELLDGANHYYRQISNDGRQYNDVDPRGYFRQGPADGQAPTGAYYAGINSNCLIARVADDHRPSNIWLINPRIGPFGCSVSGVDTYYPIGVNKGGVLVMGQNDTWWADNSGQWHFEIRVFANMPALQSVYPEIG